VYSHRYLKPLQVAIEPLESHGNRHHEAVDVSVRRLFAVKSLAVIGLRVMLLFLLCYFQHLLSLLSLLLHSSLWGAVKQFDGPHKVETAIKAFAALGYDGIEVPYKIVLEVSHHLVMTQSHLSVFTSLHLPSTYQRTHCTAHLGWAPTVQGDAE
jgi:hypothetical protein